MIRRALVLLAVAAALPPAAGADASTIAMCMPEEVALRMLASPVWSPQHNDVVILCSTGFLPVYLHPPGQG